MDGLILCKKDFLEDNKSFFNEGEWYPYKISNDTFGDYYVVYNKEVTDFVIFNPTYEKVEANAEEYFCIREYFYLLADWREMQIDNILSD